MWQGMDSRSTNSCVGRTAPPCPDNVTSPSISAVSAPSNSTHSISTERVLNSTQADVFYGSVSMIAPVLITAALIVLGNSLTLVAIGRTHSLQSKSNAFVASLAVADLCVGAMLLPYGLWLFPGIRDFIDNAMAICLLMLSVGTGVTIVSLSNLFLIAVDRWLYISRPFFYQRAVTNSVIGVGIAISWTIGLALGVAQWILYSPQTDPPQCVVSLILPVYYFKYIIPLFYFVVCVAVFIIYIGIVVIAKRQQKKIMLDTLSVQNNHHSGAQQRRQKRKALRLNDKNWKAVKMIMTLFGVFFLCWTPRMVFFALQGDYVVEHFPPFFFDLILFLGLFNSGINFLVYPLHSREFRTAFRDILCRYCRRETKVQPVNISIGHSNLDLTNT